MLDKVVGVQGTSFYIEPDGTIGILLTQMEMPGPDGSVLNEVHRLGN